MVRVDILPGILFLYQSVRLLKPALDPELNPWFNVIHLISPIALVHIYWI